MKKVINIIGIGLVVLGFVDLLGVIYWLDHLRFCY